MPEHGGGLRPDQVQQHLLLLGRGQPGQLPGAASRRRAPRPAARPAGTRTRPRHSGGSVPAPAWARSPARSRSGRAPAAARPRPSAASSSARPCSADSAPHPAAGPLPVGLAQVPGHPAGLLPQPPRERRPRAARGPPLRGQRVQERVRRRVVPLPRRCRTSPPPRRTARTPPGPASAVSSCRCQRRVGLGPQHRVDPGRGQRPDHPVIEHPGRVHHRGQRMRRRAPAASSPASAARSAASQAATCTSRARPGQLRGQRAPRPARPGRDRLASSSRPRPARRGQVPGHQPAQHPGPPGDQHRPGRGPAASGRRSARSCRYAGPGS